MAKLDRNDGAVLTLGTVAALAVAGVWRYRSIPDPSTRGSSNHLVKGEQAKWSQEYIDIVTSAPKRTAGVNRRLTVILRRMSRSEAQKARMTVTAVLENSYNVRDLHTGEEVSVADWMLVAGDSKTRKWPGTGYQGVKPKGSKSTGNLWWKDVKSTDQVMNWGGKAWIAVRDGKRYLVNWSSYDASEAQAFLKKRASKGSKSFGFPSVLVKFKNPRHNYVTSVAVGIDEQKARKYFVGAQLDVGTYPQERIEKVIDIEYTPASGTRQSYGSSNTSENATQAGFRDWLRKADDHLQEYGFGHEQYPLSEWRKLYKAGASWQAAVERIAGEEYGSQNHGHQGSKAKGSDILQGDFATFDDFSKEVRRVRLRNKNKWWGANATVAGRHVTLKAFGNGMASGRYRVDGVDWTPGYGDESVKEFNWALAEPFKSGSMNHGHHVLVEMLGGQQAVGAAIRHVAKSDPSGTNLEVLRQVMEVLESKLELNDSEMQAVKRLQMIVRNAPNGSVALLTNNLFKAANSLGLDLPHYSF